MFFSGENKKNKKIVKLIIILLIAIVTASIAISSLSPIFEGKCIAKAQEISTNITNIQASKVLRGIEYSDLITVQKNLEDKVTALTTNVVKINVIASDIAVNIQKELSNTSKEKVYIPSGSLLGVEYLSGFGPEIGMNIIPAGTVTTEIKSELKEAGINQTIHRIYLSVVCDVNILTPFKTIKTQITNQVLMGETVLLGNIPQNYYNIEGINSNELIEFVE
ncbi:MAG: sporulation protein YunB [Lachnospiraceae bacterium]|nr:sporulation protein YunB [Lachnospiraceae bacterium]